ncbi:hypothetical protein [Sphingomonas sp. Root1294]|uniref:hypothetical protein n=1 Tax=Sphingomonas sp. Root1294 TaxID=1736447 RepID=UPI000A9AA54D|nr:hypothetical protein [Sphingomonas sp. Root1294]
MMTAEILATPWIFAGTDRAAPLGCGMLPMSGQAIPPNHASDSSRQNVIDYIIRAKSAVFHHFRLAPIGVTPKWYRLHLTFWDRMEAQFIGRPSSSMKLVR